MDDDTANQNQQEDGAQPPQHPLDDRDFEAWLAEFYKLYKLRRRRVRDTEVRVDPKLPKRIPKGCGYGTCQWCDPSMLADGHSHTRVRDERYGTPVRPPFDSKKPENKKKAEESSLADGYTHLSRTWRQQRNQGGTIRAPPMAATDHTSPATNSRIRPIRDNKFEVVSSLVAALLFVIGGCLVLSFSSPEVNGPLFTPIVCLFTAGYVVLILYDINSRSVQACEDARYAH